jgi:ATP-binding protein involved in chromosome partitioning
MANINENIIREVLKNVKDINSSENIINTGTLSNVVIKDKLISIILSIKHNKDLYKELINQCENLLYEYDNSLKYNILLTSENNNNYVKSKNMNKQDNIKNGIKPEGIKNIIAIASGKGGVGKSTLTTNLAISLSKKNIKVGILDADIYGPSQPRMLGIKDAKPEQTYNGKITTVNKFGVKCMSIGFLINEDKPMVWRGPMVQGALEQLIKDVEWGKLDLLLIDMPPGTGDVQLTMSQRVPLTGALIVSTPQDIALIDARKGLNMFKKVEVPIVGIVENMSYYICPNCGSEEKIFSHGGAKQTSSQMEVNFLGEIPLDIDIRINSDKGTPDKLILENNKNAVYFDKISEKLINFIKMSDKKNNTEPVIKFE